jgi:hypothetical protein
MLPRSGNHYNKLLTPAYRAATHSCQESAPNASKPPIQFLLPSANPLFFPLKAAQGFLAFMGNTTGGRNKKGSPVTGSLVIY